MVPELNGVTITGQIGNGAGSIVFKGRDDATGESLAVKSVTRAVVLEIQKHAPSPEYAGDISKLLKVYLSQVRNEWKLGHRLTNLAGGHVGIPRMHELIRENGFLRTNGLHLVMDFVEGENLRKGHNYSIEELIHIYRQAADVLRLADRRLRPRGDDVLGTYRTDDPPQRLRGVVDGPDGPPDQVFRDIGPRVQPQGAARAGRHRASFVRALPQGAVEHERGDCAA